MDFCLTGQTGALFTNVDVHAGDWPSQSIMDLLRIADECLKPRMAQRAEVVEVRLLYLILYCLTLVCT